MRLDALTVEILRNYLQGAVEEMAYVTERTAYTTFVKETADFTAGLARLKRAGVNFAYARHERAPRRLPTVMPLPR